MEALSFTLLIQSGELAVMPLTRMQLKMIYTLKHREEKKSMIILVADENMIRQYVSDPSPKILSYIYFSRKTNNRHF